MQAWALGGAGALEEGHPHLLRSGDDGMLLCSVVVIRELGLQAGCAGALVHGLRSASAFFCENFRSRPHVRMA